MVVLFNFWGGGEIIHTVSQDGCSNLYHHPLPPAHKGPWSSPLSQHCFCSCHGNGYEVISPDGFDWHFPGDHWYYRPCAYFLLRNISSDLLPSFNWVIFLFLLQKFTLYQLYDLQISSAVWLSLPFVVSQTVQKLSSLTKPHLSVFSIVVEIMLKTLPRMSLDNPLYFLH